MVKTLELLLGGRSCRPLSPSRSFQCVTHHVVGKRREPLVGDCDQAPAFSNERHRGSNGFDLDPSIALPDVDLSAPAQPQAVSELLWNDDAASGVNGAYHGLRIPFQMAVRCQYGDGGAQDPGITRTSPEAQLGSVNGVDAAIFQLAEDVGEVTLLDAIEDSVDGGHIGSDVFRGHLWGKDLEHLFLKPGRPVTVAKGPGWEVRLGA